MEKLIDRLSAVVAEAFSAAGYDPACGRVTQSSTTKPRSSLRRTLSTACRTAASLPQPRP